MLTWLRGARLAVTRDNDIMTAKTNAQRQADYRAKKKAEQSDEVRGIFAPKHLHEAIKAKIREFIEKNKTA